MSGVASLDRSKLAARKKGVRLCMLVSESNSCKAAYRFLKAFLVPSLDELHVVTAISSEGYREAAALRQRELVETELQGCARYHVVLKEDDYSLYESLGRYVASVVRPSIIFMGSANLCTAAGPSARPASRAGTPGVVSWGASTPRVGTPATRPGTSAGTGSSSRPGTGAGAFDSLALSLSSLAGGLSGLPGVGLGLAASSNALKLLPELRCAPVLLAKHNSRGSWLSNSGAAASFSSGATQQLGASGAFGATGGSQASPAASPSAKALLRSASSMRRGGGAAAAAEAAAGGSGGGNPPMRVMVDLQANSRHVLDWLFEHFTPGRDHLVLTVSQAYDEQHHVKPAAARLLTAFGVQAAVNAFEAEKAVLAGPANKSLPQAVADSEPDVLVLQAPRCKGLPPPLVELLYCARTSFLIWPPDYDARQRPTG